jgi:hypothetical protein
MAPANKVVFADIQEYLEAIANNPADNGDVDQSNHGRFWQMSYQDFTSKPLPGEDCNGSPIPIVNKTTASPNVDPAQCPFFQALTNAAGWCNKGQMPKNGPPAAFITDSNYKVKLKNNSTITGSEIKANIEWWLTHGLPEK